MREEQLPLFPMKGSLVQIMDMVDNGYSFDTFGSVGMYQLGTYPTWKTFPGSETFDIQGF